jgi:hypothetical protein
MRRFPASFLRAPKDSPSRRGRRRAGRALRASALLAFVVALTPAVDAAAAQAPASITDATTGLSDAATVAPVPVCAPSPPGRATCLAQMLVTRGTSVPVHPRLRRPASPYRLRRPVPPGSHVAAAAVAAAAAPQPGTPAYVQQAYDLASLAQTAGTGTTVAIVDVYDDPTAEADLAAYRAEFGLPACTTANRCFAKYDEYGGTSYPTKADPNYPQWMREISLDLDAVSALCPNCHIALVEAASTNLPDLGLAQLAASRTGASVISDSWYDPLTTSQARTFLTSGDYTFPGITTVAASGDSGYAGAPPNDASTNNFPAALPGVTAAGGTTLEPASSSGVPSGRGFTESAWSLGGSGCNVGASKPAYQIPDTTGCTGRSYADISADADPDTGMQAYDSADGGWTVLGGTSESAALIAAYYALLGSSAQGPQWAYANASLLNDPSTGSNGACPAKIFFICNARPGYDGPTGVGSISGAVTNGAPGVAGPGTNGSYALNVTDDSAQLQGGVYPNNADTTYWWEYGTTTAYGQQTPANDIGSGTNPVSVSDSLPGLSAATTYHYRLVAKNRFGTEYGYDYALTTPAPVTSSPTQGSGQNPPANPSPSPSPPSTTTSNPSVSGIGAGAGSAGALPVGAPGLTNIRVGASASTATVSATIATGGAATTYSLQYGTTRSLGKSFSSSQASGATANVSWTFRNLAPGKVYYFRVVASNAAGTGASVVVGFRTSPVTITRITLSGNVLGVLLRCHGSAACRVRLLGRTGTRLMLSSRATIRGNRSGTVTLRLTKSFQTLATHDRSVLLVLSTWHGSTATVSAPV